MRREKGEPKFNSRLEGGGLDKPALGGESHL